MTKQIIENQLLRMDIEPTAITLDWLSLYYTQEPIVLPAHFTEGEIMELSDDCFLIGIDRPTLHFLNCAILMYQGQESATLLFNSRNEKFFKADVIKVDFQNQTLYNGNWYRIYQTLCAYGFTYKSASRIDIAIDGVNYLHQILNHYAKQTASNKVIGLKNSSAHRARFSAKVLNPINMQFENFNMGNVGSYSKSIKSNSSGSNKMVTLYNKTLEIAKSGKTYIQDWWLANGVIEKKQDLDKLAEQIEAADKVRKNELFVLEGLTNIYRFEMRLKSEAIKEINGFNIDMLTTAQGLASILKLHCKKYFEGFFYSNDSNVTRNKAFDLLPFTKLGATSISKIKRVETDGIYKAKLMLHSSFYDYYLGKVNESKTAEILEAMQDKAIQYNLINHLADKLEEWHNRYAKLRNENRITETVIFTQILTAFVNQHKTAETEYLRRVHNQAAATAAFGE